MNTPKRSLLYVIRKKSRTLLLFVILLIVSTLTLSGLSIMDATKDTSAELRESTGTSFTMEQNMETATRIGEGNSYLLQQEYITDEMVSKISKIDGISGNDASYGGQKVARAELQDIKGHKLDLIVYTDMWEDDISAIVGPFGCSNTENQSFFKNKQFILTEGRHITSDDENKVIISNAVAEQNGLKVGDKIVVAVTNFISEGQGTKKVEVEIIGLYDIFMDQSDKATLTTFELYEDYTFLDTMSYKELFSMYKEITEGYNTVTFFVTDPAQLSSIMSEVSKTSSINWNNFNLIANDEVYQASSSSMSNVEKLITTMIVVVVVISAAIITLILSMWLKSRVRETGVLMAVGISKYKILLQHVLEVAVIAVFAFGLSYFASGMIAGNLGNILDSSISASNVIITVSDFILVCAVGTLILLLAIGISSIPVMRMKPREILSKMS